MADATRQCPRKVSKEEVRPRAGTLKPGPADACWQRAHHDGHLPEVGPPAPWPVERKVGQGDRDITSAGRGGSNGCGSDARSATRHGF